MISSLHKTIFLAIVLLSFNCYASDADANNSDFFSKLKIICAFLIFFGFFSVIIKKFSSKIKLPINNYKNSPIIIKQKVILTPSSSLILAEINELTLLLSATNTGITILKEIKVDAKEENNLIKTEIKNQTEDKSKTETFTEVVSIHCSKQLLTNKLLNFKSSMFWKSRGRIKEQATR
jgi:flagellar biogenesis protein FliO